MKAALTRLLVRLFLGYAKTHRQLIKARLRVGDTPRNVTLSVWDFKPVEYKVQVWYPLSNLHEEFLYSNLEDAMADVRLIEQHLGKPVP